MAREGPIRKSIKIDPRERRLMFVAPDHCAVPVERSTAGPLRSEWIPVKCDAARESCYDDFVEHLRMIRCGNRSSHGQGSDALDDEGLTRCDAVHRGLESRASEGTSRCSVCFNVWLVVGQRISMTSAAAVVSGPSLELRRSDRRSVR